ncbi:hypothetical protein C8J57DRAFT_1240520 [Mycena rebaudengoi]|nr:hypothetical protein C8J57DRAFT_1240520 [Mycena rebaudengoi]
MASPQLQYEAEFKSLGFILAKTDQAGTLRVIFWHRETFSFAGTRLSWSLKESETADGTIEIHHSEDFQLADFRVKVPSDGVHRIDFTVTKRARRYSVYDLRSVWVTLVERESTFTAILSMEGM